MPPPAALTQQVAELSAAGYSIDTSTLTRALYSGDASEYRVPPVAAMRPRTTTELAEVVAKALELGVPISSRGAGTSIAGNSIGPGLVVDCAGLNQLVHLNVSGRSALVEPGVIPASLTAAAAPFGLRFGPDPSTVDRCTIGGMIGNNACGPRALGFGRTVESVLGLEVVTGSGEQLSLGSAQSSSPTLAALRELVMANLGVIRTEFGHFRRQVSGYGLEHLLPENGFDVARFLVGSEGTLAVVTRARVRLVDEPPHKALVVIGYPDMAAAADATPALLPFGPTAVEGLDRRILEAAQRRNRTAPDLPAGDGWLFTELGDPDAGALADRTQAVLKAAGGLGGQVITDPELASRLWRIRANGAGLAAAALPKPGRGGWEDSAVPPEALGAYLRDFETLLGSHGLHGLPYGHFGEGCLHVRIDFDLCSPAGVAGYRSFVEEAAELVAGYGGSCSGEHGDGRARSELLSRMYSPEAVALFGAVKHIFDPGNLLNPGVLVDPRPLDADLRLRAAAGSRLPRIEAGFAAAAHRCTGVAECLTARGPMCPSYQATGREQDSTRGRARVLQEMINGDLVSGGWRAPEVHQALDLCLSCKACATECPTGTDLAALKSKVLEESYRGRVRPRAHYSLGWLPTWSRAITAVPGLAALANAVLAAPGLGRAIRRVAGVDPRRNLPRFSTRSARRRAPDGRSSRATSDPGSATEVVVWVDSFTDALDASRLDALLAVLHAAGFSPKVLRAKACCGLPWITTGQRRHAAKLLTQALEVLHPIISAGTPVVGMEPSCIAVWRSDATDLLDDPRVTEVAEGVLTLAEVLECSDWIPPSLSGVTVVAQPHCHQSAVVGWAADEAILARTGATVVKVEGCCGLAGNFGVERGHYETSEAIAENHLLPAVRAAGPDAVLLADGFSCRTQLADLAGRQSLTLGELLSPAIGFGPTTLT